MRNRKHILVIARHNPVEALRVAAGLTLLNDKVKVDVLGQLADSPEIAEQKEVLEFAEVPCEVLGEIESGSAERLANDILSADVVYML